MLYLLSKERGKNYGSSSTMAPRGKMGEDSFTCVHCRELNNLRDSGKLGFKENCRKYRSNNTGSVVKSIVHEIRTVGRED